MGDVVSLDAYRHGIRVDGDCLVWRGYRHQLSPERARDLGDILQLARVIPGRFQACGFEVESTRKEIRIEGWDMGPAVVRCGAEATSLALGVALVACRKVGSK